MESIDDGKRKPTKVDSNDENARIEELKLDFSVVSVGVMKSIFHRKNGTPRQSGICPQSKGIISLHKKLFNNPNHAWQGIDQFDYVWILFYFHENQNKRRFIAKVHPPRLNGSSCGVFASRSPHRPNPFGLTLAKVDCIKDGDLHVSGIDILDQTPIIDVKPYIEKYDYPFLAPSLDLRPSIPNSAVSENSPTRKDGKSPPDGWVDGSVVAEIDVDFTERSLSQLSAFHSKSFHETNQPDYCDYCLQLFSDRNEAKAAIVNVLRADPRSVYRRTKCLDRLYFFIVDTIHITAWFDIDTNLVQVVKIKPYKCKN